MTNVSRDHVRDELITILSHIRDDWEGSAEITETTGLFRDLGFESIDAIALGNALEDHFNRTLPFVPFLTKAREEQWTDINVGHLTEFLLVSLNGLAKGHTQ
jgi:acyl carrier protein